MAKLFRKKMLLAKIETTYGVDATPTGAANAILTKDLSINLMQGNTVERNVDRTTLGGDIAIHVAPYTTVSFSVELASSGAAGTAPAWGPLLQACGFSETLVASTTATYAPVSTGFKSATLYFHIDGLLHKLLGCRGTFTVSMDPGSLPYLNFTFTGIRAAPTDTALPTPTLTAFKTPLAVNKANTPTFSLHGVAATVEKFTFDFARERMETDASSQWTFVRGYWSLEGDAYVGENGFPEAGEPDDAEDHEQPLDAERHDDVLPDDHAGLGGDGEHFRQARGRVVQNDRVRHFNGRFRTEAAHCHADTGHGEYRGVVDAVTYKKYGLPGAERFQLGGLAFGEQPGAVLVEMQFLGDDGGAFGAIARQHDQPFNTLTAQ